MKIKNKSIIIKNGDTVYELNNMILDTYLKKLAKKSTNTNLNSLPRYTSLEYCLLKFDDPLEFDETSYVNNSDFDLVLTNKAVANQIISQSKVDVQYNYNFSEGSMILKKGEYNAGKYLDEFYGHKITAIGFNSTWQPNIFGWDIPVCAILDVSNYNLYLEENQNFSVTRKDSISSDALFWSGNEKIEGAYHLAPLGGQSISKYEYESENSISWTKFYNIGEGILYSVGFSNSIDSIKEEKILDFLVDTEVKENVLTIKNIELKNSIATTFLKRFLPMFPTRNNYKYLILKYHVWQDVYSKQNGEIIIEHTDTGISYHMAIPIDSISGKKEIKLIYERS